MNREHTSANTAETKAKTKALELAAKEREDYTPAQREVLQGNLSQHEKEFHIRRLGLGKDPLPPGADPFRAWSRLTVLNPAFGLDNPSVAGGPDSTPEKFLSSARQHFGAQVDDPNSEEGRAVRTVLESRMTPAQRQAATAPGGTARFMEALFGRNPATQQLGDFIGGKPAAQPGPLASPTPTPSATPAAPAMPIPQPQRPRPIHGGVRYLPRFNSSCHS